MLLIFIEIFVPRCDKVRYDRSQVSNVNAFLCVSHDDTGNNFILKLKKKEQKREEHPYFFVISLNNQYTLRLW